MRLALTDMTGINGVEHLFMADITENTFIGTTAVKDRNGSLGATFRRIFPEVMRGAGEGHYAWDLPDSTMTNAAATCIAKAARATLKVRYARARSRSPSRDDAHRRAHLGDTALLVPGANVCLLGCHGGAIAVRDPRGENGVKPPM